MNRINPFDAIYSQINMTTAEEKISALPDFPRLLDVELTNTCNFKCLMCPVGTKVQKRKPGFMSDYLFDRLMDEVTPHKTPLRFILWGEPTLHKNWLAYMAQAKKLGVPVHFNTNGYLLDLKQMRQVVDLGIDSVKFSFQGVDVKSYREMRNINYYEGLLQKVEELHTIRGDEKAPFIHVSTTITYETAEQTRLFRERIEKITDKVTVGRTELGRFDVSSAKLNNEEAKTMKMLQEKESLIKKHPNCCPEVWDKLSLHYDGKVSACCRDFGDVMEIGDFCNTSLGDIWKSKRLQAYRDVLAAGNFDSLPLCRVCYDYQGLQTSGLQEI